MNLMIFTITSSSSSSVSQLLSVPSSYFSLLLLFVPIPESPNIILVKHKTIIQMFEFLIFLHKDHQRSQLYALVRRSLVKNNLLVYKNILSNFKVFMWLG